MTGNVWKTMLFTFLALKMNVFGSSLNDIWMTNIAQELGDDLERFQDEELGISYINNLYGTFNYTTILIDANKTVNEIAQKLEHKIDDIVSALSQAKNEIENITVETSILLPCLKNNSEVCDTCSDSINLRNILYKVKSNMKLMNGSIKQTYLMSSTNLESSPISPFFDCTGIDHETLFVNYMSRNRYVAKNIILLLDHGGSLSKKHFTMVTSFAKKVIESLAENDRIAVLAISDDWISPQLKECPTLSHISTDIPHLTQVNASIKKIMYKFIDGLYKGTGATNHSLILQKAFKVIHRSEIVDETVMILYVSRGLLSSLGEVRTVLEVLAQSVKPNIIINTCAVIDDTRPTIYETQFLEDVAHQNYQKYNVSFLGDYTKGTMISVNSTEAIHFALAQFYRFFNKGFDVGTRISLPTWDPISNDLTISFSTGFNHNDFQLIGVDVYFSAWAEDLIYFNNRLKEYYAFLLDKTGKVLIHPKFASLTTVAQQLHFVDISNFEKVHLFDIVKNRLLKEVTGYQLTTRFGLLYRWSWRHVASFIVCLVTPESPTAQTPHGLKWPFNGTKTMNLIYQRLQNNEQKLCRHLNQVATLDAGSLYLASSCFQSPKSGIRNLTAVENYLQDNSGLMPNPGLKTGIKDEVAALAQITHFLRNQHLTSLSSKYIVRRYVASFGGVLQMFPGTVLNQGLDPTTRPWFLKAVEHRRRLVMVPPYLDEGGAGYIVTIAYATDRVVVAVDVTYGYVFRLLVRRMPFCFSVNVTCFMMDDRGYLVYHPNLIEVNGHGPIEKQHVIHKESLVANDILNHHSFIKKMLCNSYGGSTVQRYYKLNTSYSEVLVSRVQGDQCVSYHIAVLRNTNVFVGIVNATCNVVLTFCPCSIVDRLCLNCNRMEQKECECPCECPLQQNQCRDYNNSNNEICNWFPEHVSSKGYFTEDVRDGIKPCFSSTCSKEKTHMRCLGVTGCEWCKFDVDGAPLGNPFCASMPTCFNGVLGSISPYRNFHEESAESYHVPISVISLFVFGILLLLCMFYIYHRSTAPSTNGRLYLSSIQDHLRMSDLNVSDNFHSLGNHRDKLLQDEKSDPISPYCVSNNYKRSALTAESDHGYSTMTQHDESEHLSLAPVEFESDDLASDSLSTRTSVSNKPQGKEPNQFTCLPKNKCIVVSVTVHRHMETA